MKITKEEEKQVLENYGLIRNKILAAKMRIDRNRLRKIAKFLGIWEAPRSTQEMGYYVDIEELELKYKTESKQGCALFFGVSLAQITHLLKVNKIFKTRKVTIKEGVFNKPPGWNPITNSVLDNPMDARFKELDIIKTYKTYRHEHGTKRKYDF